MVVSPALRDMIVLHRRKLMLAKRRTRESGLSVGTSLEAACLVNDAKRDASMA